MQTPLDEMGRLVEAQPEPDQPAGKAVSGGSNAVSTPRIGVIRNPKSHYNRKSAAEQIDLPGVLRLAPRGRPEIAAALTQFAEQRIELLVIDGGDGTIRDILTEGLAVFGENWPRLLVLPSGKTNALALDLGMPKKLKLAEALEALPQARIVKRRPLLIERTGKDGKTLMGFLFGAGVFNAVIDAGQVAHRFGAFQSTAVAVTGIAGIVQALVGVGRSAWRRTVPMHVALGENAQPLGQSDHATPGERYLLGVSTLQNFPLGMRPFGKVEGELRFLAWDSPLRRLIAFAPAVLMGWDAPFMRGLGLFRGAADDIRLSFEGSFILDGESFPPGELRISAGHEVQFLVP
jgi:diacylglycerol kinase (ATP)